MFPAIFTIGLVSLAVPADEVVLDRPVPERVTGNILEKTLETKVSASWRNVELRTILNRLADGHKTAVLLDRGIDPNQELDLNLAYQPLEEAFQAVAKSARAEISILGNTVYVGPADRAAKLRTLEHLRSQEAFAREDRLPRGRVLDFSRVHTVHWNDLDEPRTLAVDLAKRAGIEIANPEAIPHDLWAGGTLPNANITEALSLILIQFDLTFEWSADTTRIRLLQVPETVGIEKPYAPAGGPPKLASRTVWEKFLQEVGEALERQAPGIAVKTDVPNRRLLISATLEQHEQLSGKNRSKPGDRPAEKTPPIRNRQFTLRIERVPASAIIKTLEESGIKFEYDADQLAARKINLDTPINMDVDKAGAEEFFKALCDPLGLKFTIDNVTVTLTPK